MTLQLGFDGSVKLQSSDDASLHECIERTLPTYQEYAKRISFDTSNEREVYWRIVFSLLSVHSPIGATLDVYSSLRLWRVRFGRMPSIGVLHRIVSTLGRDGVIQYPYQKATYLREFDLGWGMDRSRFLRCGEDDATWRDRLVREVKGVAMAKASFAVALSNPVDADVCCVDTHMYQLFKRGDVPRRTVKRRDYLDIEGKVRELARVYKVGCFVIQWLLWDAKRGVREPHAELRGA
mgnify:FL=1